MQRKSFYSSIYSQLAQVESVKSLLFNVCNCITVKKPTGKIYLVEAIIHLRNNHKDVVYALQIGIRNKGMNIWRNFKAILIVLSILYPRNWFWLFPYYADNQITIKVKKNNKFWFREGRKKERKKILWSTTTVIYFKNRNTYHLLQYILK